MIVTLAIVALFVFIYRGSIFQHFASQYLSEALTQSGSGNVQAPLLNSETLVEGAVKNSNPAVVSIVISKEVPKYDTYGGTDPFGGLFGNPFGNLFQVPQYRQNGTEKQDVGAGSGFLVSADGLIVTNRHVVDDQTAQYTVFTNDGKKHSAKVIARDSVLDVAVIKIDQVLGEKYSFLSFGDSDNLQLGQSVIAIGNALGQFRNSVSVGVISGLSRSIVAGDNAGMSESLGNVIQTDAAINPGNSGGPLLDLYGRVVGVNVAVAQGSESVGFALPINSIKSVVESVKKTGKIVRPYLGVRYVAVTPELKDKNNLSVDYGVLVSRGQTTSDLAVIPGSPADKAGIVENDIILEIDGVKIDNDHDLASIVRGKNVGDTISLKVLHKGTEETVQVKLENAPQGQ